MIYIVNEFKGNVTFIPVQTYQFHMVILLYTGQIRWYGKHGPVCWKIEVRVTDF